MIIFNEKEGEFHLQTKNSSYIIKVLKSGHVANLYYGKKIHHNVKFENFIDYKKLPFGSMTSYDEKDSGFSLDFQTLEYSTYGKGDYRDPSISLSSENGDRTFDFLYKTHKIIKEKPEIPGLPSSYKGAEGDEGALVLELVDLVELRLHCITAVEHIAGRYSELCPEALREVRE